MKKITEEQFYQLLGLVTAGREYTKLIDSLFKAYSKIVGKDEDGRFWDYMYESDLYESLRKHLPHDSIEVIWKTKEKEGSTT